MWKGPMPLARQGRWASCGPNAHHGRQPSLSLLVLHLRKLPTGQRDWREPLETWAKGCWESKRWSQISNRELDFGEALGTFQGHSKRKPAHLWLPHRRPPQLVRASHRNSGNYQRLLAEHQLKEDMCPFLPPRQNLNMIELRELKKKREHLSLRQAHSPTPTPRLLDASLASGWERREF